jgi:predicted esterase
MIDDA